MQHGDVSYMSITICNLVVSFLAEMSNLSRLVEGFFFYLSMIPRISPVICK